MKECCETGAPKKRYWHWVVLGCVVLLPPGLQMIPGLRGYFGTQCGKAPMHINAIMACLDDYALNNEHKYPDTLLPLITPDANGHCYLVGYNGRIPRDPWERPYLYEPPSAAHPRPRVFTLGADGQPGGSGDDADIDSDHLDEGR